MIVIHVDSLLKSNRLLLRTSVLFNTLIRESAPPDGQEVAQAAVWDDERVCTTEDQLTWRCHVDNA